MADREPRALVIVLNEATLDLVGPWAAEGSLPTMARMIEGGLCGRLWSRGPLFGPERWGNFVTGQDANHHGLTEFLRRDGSGNFVPIAFGPEHGLQAAPIWKSLSEGGIPCGIVNAPLAYPEDVAQGFIVQEMLDAFAWRRSETQGWRRLMAKPADLHDQLQARFGPADPDVHHVDKDVFVPLLEAQVERQGRVLSLLLKERDWRFCLTRLTQIADAQHHLWGDQISSDSSNPHRDGIKRVYQAVDRALATILDSVGQDTTVFVVSDCGAGPLQAGVQLNTWLANEGFLRRANRVDKVAAKLRRALSARRRPKPRDRSIDWSRTTAYAVGVESGIAINLRGREPGGIVEPGSEYRETCERIVARIETLVDPQTGQAAVKQVHRASDLYAPPVAAGAPDLLVEWRDGAYLPAEIEDVPNAVFVPHRQHGKVLSNTGGHRPDGLLLATGRGVVAGEQREGSVFDLVPTCLRLLDQPVPPELRGQSLLG